MNFDVAANLYPVLPEILLAAMACIILVIDLFLKDSQRVVTYALAQLTLIGAAVATAWVAAPVPQIVFDGSYIRDAMSDALKIALFVIGIFTFVYSKDYLRQRELNVGEYYVLGLVALLGMSIMISANSFLTAYLGLELLASPFTPWWPSTAAPSSPPRRP